jgi:hypothetical protein
VMLYIMGKIECGLMKEMSSGLVYLWENNAPV